MLAQGPAGAKVPKLNIIGELTSRLYTSREQHGAVSQDSGSVKGARNSENVWQCGKALSGRIIQFGRGNYLAIAVHATKDQDGAVRQQSSGMTCASYAQTD